MELQKKRKKEIKYDTFGQILSDSNPNFDFPFRFAGGLWDEDTKLVRFGVRDYDPEVGRWTSKEPLGFKGSRNFYVYAGNDSVNFVDLDGLNPFKKTRINAMGLPDRGFGAGSLDTVSELGAKSAPVWVPAIIGMFTFGLGGAINGFAGFVIQNGVTNVCVGMAVRNADDEKTTKFKVASDLLFGLAIGGYIKGLSSIEEFSVFPMKINNVIFVHLFGNSLQNCINGNNWEQGYSTATKSAILIGILSSF